eukprot:m.47839 g.47839  ORF g.47839 m.47839 type:complete len:64 (-) comp11003_c0_seq2:153-344(-)
MDSFALLVHAQATSACVRAQTLTTNCVLQLFIAVCTLVSSAFAVNIPCLPLCPSVRVSEYALA